MRFYKIYYSWRAEAEYIADVKQNKKLKKKKEQQLGGRERETHASMQAIIEKMNF